MNSLGSILLAWRTKEGLSSAEAARRCGFSPQLYWQLEHDKAGPPQARTFHKLAAGTGIPFNDLAPAAYGGELVAAMVRSLSEASTV